MSLFAIIYMLFTYLLGSISSDVVICRFTERNDARVTNSNVLQKGGIGLFWQFFYVMS